MHPFTARKIAEAKALYEGMTAKKEDRNSIPNRSIHRRAVWGQGYPYHGHVTSK